MRFKELPKKWKGKIIVLSAVTILLASAIVIFNMFLASYRNSCANMRTVLVKDENDLIGERIEIARDGNASANANIYIPDNIGTEPLPVIFNIHGSGFVGGDADVLDTQSDRIANEWNVTDTIEYENAVHSFIESNNPEGTTGSSDDMSYVINAEQESLARQAEDEICDWISNN